MKKKRKKQSPIKQTTVGKDAHCSEQIRTKTRKGERRSFNNRSGGNSGGGYGNRDNNGGNEERY
jgi:hypothetical protein